MEGAPSATNNGNQGLGVAADGNTFGPQGAFGTPSTGSGYQQAQPSYVGGMEDQNALGTTGYGGPSGSMGFTGGLPQYSDLGQTPQQQNPLFPQQQNVTYNYASSGGGQNPYLADQAKAITTGFNRNLQETVLPGLRDKFVGSGGLGGSRQGIAEGLAASRSGEGLANAITNMYGNAWEGDQNRAVQYANIGTNANNAQMQNDLNRLNSERGFYSTNRGQDLQQMGLAAGLLGQANQGFIGQGQGLYNVGTQEQNAPWQQLAAYSGILAPYQQAGATNTGTQQYEYNPWMQGLGAATGLAGAAGGLGWKPFG